MKIPLVVFVLFVGIQAEHLKNLAEWENFKVAHGKCYTTDEEEADRKAAFLENMQKIEEHNNLYERGLVSYKRGVNKYSDMSYSELVKIMNGHKPSLSSGKSGRSFVVPTNVQVPDYFDWREKGAVTAVKDQGHCGSCWAFSTTGTLEGQLFLKNKKLVSLSEQNLIDCSIQNAKCGGGNPIIALADIYKIGGIDTEESYPYEGKNDTCRYNPRNSAGTDKGFARVKPGSEEDLKIAVAIVGPISVSIDASNLSIFQYHSGVYDEPKCTSEYDRLDHSVLVVGYGTTKDGKDYWIVKNSWGTSFGEDGYILMSRNKNNQCGIATQAIVPVV